ncbi:MAG: DNA mismatch repair endonuclease MutL, partial [candidate division Zixibacteria bacterium]|nr:DNA mismatch repair endonuclease MutL [candidate division Zixibacteria bacterium]
LEVNTLPAFSTASGKVAKLPENLINQIAAGEVVERPASVVKELVENALDAGTAEITVEIEGAGHHKIKVTDNGSGIPAEDVSTVLERHATSKLKSAEELEHIATLGFRGEALPSIASVSHFELGTKAKGERIGTRLIAEAGKILKVEPAGMADGTKVTVERLFFNTPARKKFQKSAVSENRQITALLEQYALAFPEIGFELVLDGKQILKTPGQNLFERVSDLVGEERYWDLELLESKKENSQLIAFLKKPEKTTAARPQFYFFINRRPVQSKLLHHAVLSAYRDFLEHGKAPYALIYLFLPYPEVDVNVHPAKAEVRFADERAVYDWVYHAVRKALSSRGQVPVWTGSPPQPHQAIEKNSPPASAGGLSGNSSIADLSYPQKVFTFPRTAEASATGESPTHAGTSTNFSPIFWQFADIYILAQVKGKLLLIDQHTAHERVLYEKILKGLGERKAESQELLFPETVELSPSEFQAFSENQQFFELFSFDLSPFGDRTLLVRGTPPLAQKKNPSKLLREILDDLENDKKDLEPAKIVARSLACHSAVRAGEKLTIAEMENLFDLLFAAENPYNCPHGRPTIIELPLAEIHRRFGRPV